MSICFISPPIIIAVFFFCFVLFCFGCLSFFLAHPVDMNLWLITQCVDYKPFRSIIPRRMVLRFFAIFKGVYYDNYNAKYKHSLKYNYVIINLNMTSKLLITPYDMGSLCKLEYLQFTR